jgi:hypothetical protein
MSGSLFSRRLAPKLVNGNTAEGRFCRRYERQLIAHLGGEDKITVIQRRIAERCAMLALHLVRYDQRAHRDGGLSDRAVKDYLALDGRLTKLLAQLGAKASVNGTAKPAKSVEPKPEPAASEPEATLPEYLQATAAEPESEP